MAEGLPDTPKATSWVEGNWFQVALKLAGSPYSLGALAIGLLLSAIGGLPGAFLGTWLLVWLLVVAGLAGLALDDQNAAAPGWLAARSRRRWQHVDLDELAFVKKVSNERFRLVDSAGRRAVLAMDLHNAVDVLNVVRRDLTRARKRGVEFPERLSAYVDGREQ